MGIQSVLLISRLFRLVGPNGYALAILIHLSCSRAIVRISSATSDRS